MRTLMIPNRNRRAVRSTLAKLDDSLSRIMPYDEWIARRQPPDDLRPMYHLVVSELQRDRATLLELIDG